MTNKQLRLSTAAILAASAVMTTALPANVAEAATYKDVPKSANYYDAVEVLSAQKIITGYGDGTFKPNAKITRGQVAKILTRMLDLKSNTRMQFSDVSKNHDFYQYASAVVSAGLMSKDNGKFNSKGTLTRNEYAEILVKAFNLPETNVELPFLDVTSKYRSAIRAVYGNGLMKGVSKTRFNGNGEVTRSHLVMTLHKAMKLQEEKVPDVSAKKVKFTLDQIATTTITSEDGDKYTTTTELQKLFRTANADVLKEAEIEAYVKNGKITDIIKLTIYNPAKKTVASLQTVGAYTSVARTLNGNGGNFSFPIVVDGYNVTLKNMTVPQVVTAADASIGLTLEDVTVKDRVIIGYGYTRTFNVNAKNSNIKMLEIQRDRTTVESNTKLAKVFVSEDAYDVTLNTAVEQLLFERNGFFTLYGDGSIDHIQVSFDSYLYINNRGTIKTLKVDDPEATISLSYNTKIEKAIIPANVNYRDIFSSYGLQNYISKIYHPNSTKNLLADQVVKPSKEELAYQKAVENVIKGHVHSLSGTTLTVRTNFNEILPKMKTLAFDQMIYLAGPAPNDPYIPFAYFKNGSFDETKSFNVEALQAGISLQNFLGRAKTFNDFTSNSNESITLRFDTEREFKIRTTVFVAGRANTTTETVINEGNEQKLQAALQLFVNSFEAKATGNSLFAELKVNAIEDIAKKINVNVEQQLKLHTDLQGVETLPLTIKKNNNILFNGEVAVADLKKGIIVSKLTGVPIEKIANFTAGSTTNYTYQFGTSEELNMSTSLLLDGKVQVEGEQVTLNAGATDALNNLNPVTSVQALNADGMKFTYERIATVDPAIATAPVGVKLKLASGTIPTSKVKFSIVANGKTGTAEVTAEQLKAGVNILQYATFDSSYTPLTANDLRTSKAIDIKVLSAFDGEIEAAPLIGGKEFAATGTNKVPVTKVERLASTYPGLSEVKDNQTIATLFAVNAATNGIQVTTTFGEGTATATGHLDARLKVKQGLEGTADRYVSIYFNGTLLEAYKPITVAALKTGVLLSDLIGQPTASVSSHTKGRSDKWEIVAHGNEDAFEVEAELLQIEAAGTEKVLAKASNIVNKPKLEAMVKNFTLRKEDKRYIIEAEFTGNENVDAGWNGTFVLAPKGTVATGDSATIKVTRYDDATAVNYADTITLTGNRLQAGLSTNDLNFVGETMLYKQFKHLTKAKWGFEFTAAPPEMEARFVLNNHFIKKATE